MGELISQIDYYNTFSLYYILLGHSQQIRCLYYVASKKVLVTSSDNCTVKIYDMNNGFSLYHFNLDCIVNKIILVEKENDKNNLNENIEINENVELEYEIKLPQFLIDYADKTNKNWQKAGVKLVTMATETEQGNIDEDLDDDFDELALLMEESKEKDSGLKDISENTINNLLNNKPIDERIELTPGETPTPTPGEDITPGQEIKQIGNIKITNKMVNFNKQSEEEKKYKLRLMQYKNMFESGKFNELEDLIDSCNKESALPEYKFNFTFDQYKYGNNQVSYVVRCIDNKGEYGRSDEETVGEMDAKANKYLPQEKKKK